MWPRGAVPLLALLTAGCAVRQPQTYRLVMQPNGRILIPPGVATTDVPRRTFQADVAAGRGKCLPVENAIEIRPHGRGMRVTVTRDGLLRQPPAWLSRWTVAAESQGCIAAGQGFKLASRILESLPLNPDAAYRLLHASDVETGYVDLGPENRLQVDSPILREGTPPDAPVIESAKITGLTVEVKTSANFLGFETAWYAIRPKPAGTGFSIVPISAERHIQGTVTPAPAPAANYLHFPPEASFYRLFYKAEQGTMKIMVISGATREELDGRTQAIAADPGACERFTREICILIPKGVALNPDIVVTVNGREAALPVRSTVRRAIAASGEKNAESLLPRLTVRRLYGGKPVPVEFDAASPEILNLILSGGEEISWQ